MAYYRFMILKALGKAAFLLEYFLLREELNERDYEELSNYWGE